MGEKEWARKCWGKGASGQQEGFPGCWPEDKSQLSTYPGGGQTWAELGPGNSGGQGEPGEYQRDLYQRATSWPSKPSLEPCQAPPHAPPQLRGQVAGSAASWHQELRTQHCWQGRGDRRDAMWQLLMPLALWLGAVGLGRAELTAAQQRGLQVALEEFHKHPPVQWAFRETGVDSATETVSGIAKWRRLGRDGARSQEAGAQALGLNEHPVLQGEANTPAPFSAVSWGAGEEGRVTSRIAR